MICYLEKVFLTFRAYYKFNYIFNFWSNFYVRKKLVNNLYKCYFGIPTMSDSVKTHSKAITSAVAVSPPCAGKY